MTANVKRKEFFGWKDNRILEPLAHDRYVPKVDGFFLANVTSAKDGHGKSLEGGRIKKEDSACPAGTHCVGARGKSGKGGGLGKGFGEAFGFDAE
jgi:hypothetical protein